MNASLTPESILEQIAQIQHMERGKICLMRHGPKGPYFNHQCWEKGKNLSRYVPRQEQAAVQEAIEGYQEFQRLTEQYAQLIIERTRAERAAGAKKKTPHPNSSWPKSKRSSS